MKVWDFLPKNSTYKPAIYLLCDSMALLVGHIHVQKCLQINSKLLHFCGKSFTVVPCYQYKLYCCRHNLWKNICGLAENCESFIPQIFIRYLTDNLTD